MDSIEKVCDICGKTYIARIDKFDIVETSKVRVEHLRGNKTAIFTYNTCPHCADRVIRHLFEIQKNRPNKCYFCELDRGPKHPDYRKFCEDCSGYSKFQLKKRMGIMQSYEWQAYKRYLGEEEE